MHIAGNGIGKDQKNVNVEVGYSKQGTGGKYEGATVAEWNMLWAADLPMEVQFLPVALPV